MYRLLDFYINFQLAIPHFCSFLYSDLVSFVNNNKIEIIRWLKLQNQSLFQIVVTGSS